MEDRKYWVGGNWKCNGTLAKNNELIDTLKKAEFNAEDLDVVVCPSPLHVLAVKEKIDSRIKVATQNVSKTGNGAFTGETSVDMIKDACLSWTLIGHSERRSYYHESDEDVAAKTKICQDAGLYAAVCIGETLEEREANKTMEVVERQVAAFIPSVSDWSRIVIAYEPVWAIGTGKVASPDQAQEVHAALRELLKKKVNEKIASKTRIVYGGSVSEKNCAELIQKPDIDGFLVGGASLKPAFNDIIKAVATSKKSAVR